VGKDKLSKAMRLLQEAINSKDWVRNIKPTPYSVEVLEALKKKGIKLAVFSGNSSEVLEKSLKALKIRQYFHAVVSADDVKKMKPDPEGLLKALSSLNLQKSEAIYVGDALNDVKSAKAAGVKVAVVLTGALNRKKAEVVKPDWIIEDLGGFLEILK